jgi:hypothetical protein
MPEVHRRVRLAVRLDELERRQGKARAEAAWKRQHAEQLGLELSDSEEGEEGGCGRGRSAGAGAHCEWRHLRGGWG